VANCRTLILVAIGCRQGVDYRPGFDLFFLKEVFLKEFFLKELKAN